MAYEISTLSDLLESVGEGRHIDRAKVRPAVLSARIWHAIVSFPGCLGDSHDVARSRESALSSVQYWLSDDDYSPRYVRGRLRRHGICYLRDGRVITLSQDAAASLF